MERLSPEKLLEEWNRFAAPKYQNPDVLMLSAEYNERREWGKPLEMPPEMALDGKYHIIG